LNPPTHAGLDRI